MLYRRCVSAYLGPRSGGSCHRLANHEVTYNVVFFLPIATKAPKVYLNFVKRSKPQKLAENRSIPIPLV